MNISVIRQPFLWAAVILLSGCTAIQTFPIAARPGDTISLAVGPQDGMDRSNTQVYFTSDFDGIQKDLTSNMQAVFNLYADRTSHAYRNSIQFIDDNFRYLHREPAQTVIVLDLPSTGLALGPGVINIQTTVNQPLNPLEPGYFGTYPDLESVDIALEILDGTGTSNPFRYKTLFNGTLNGDLTFLEPHRQAVIRPRVNDPTQSWTTPYGAIEIKINVPMVDIGSSGVVDDTSIRFAAHDMSAWTGSRVQSTWAYDGAEFTVMFISAIGSLYYYEPRFSIISETADFTSVPTITSVSYYDVDGNPAVGPLATDYTIELTNPL